MAMVFMPCLNKFSTFRCVFSEGPPSPGLGKKKKKKSPHNIWKN